MDRRSFIKSIAAATAAPLALLKAKPATATTPISFSTVEQWPGKVVIERYGKSPMLGDTMETGSGYTYKKYRYIRLEPNNELHKIISEEFQARNGKRWMQVYGPRQVKVII